MSKSSLNRSNTIRLPSGAMSNVRMVAIGLSCQAAARHSGEIEQPEILGGLAALHVDQPRTVRQETHALAVAQHLDLGQLDRISIGTDGQQRHHGVDLRTGVDDQAAIRGTVATRRRRSALAVTEAYSSSPTLARRDTFVSTSTAHSHGPAPSAARAL